MTAGLLRRAFGRSSIPDWSGSLRRVIADLERMNGSTEADFLAITEKLNTILGTARAISEQNREVAASLTGASGEDACAALMGVLEDARHMEKRAATLDCFAGIRESVEDCLDALRAIREQVSHGAKRSKAVKAVTTHAPQAPERR